MQFFPGLHGRPCLLSLVPQVIQDERPDCHEHVGDEHARVPEVHRQRRRSQEFQEADRIQLQKVLALPEMKELDAHQQDQEMHGRRQDVLGDQQEISAEEDEDGEQEHVPGGAREPGNLAGQPLPGERHRLGRARDQACQTQQDQPSGNLASEHQAQEPDAGQQDGAHRKCAFKGHGISQR